MEGEIHPKDIIQLPLFDQAGEDDLGVPYHMGEDAAGNSIYIMGMGALTRYCVQTMESALQFFGASDQIFLVDALTSIGIASRIGGTLSRQFHWISVGRPLVAWGICRSLPRIRRLVQSVLEVAQENYGEKEDNHRNGRRSNS